MGNTIKRYLRLVPFQRFAANNFASSRVPMLITAKAGKVAEPEQRVDEGVMHRPPQPAMWVQQYKSKISGIYMRKMSVV